MEEKCVAIKLFPASESKQTGRLFPTTDKKLKITSFLDVYKKETFSVGTAKQLQAQQNQKEGGKDND